MAAGDDWGASTPEQPENVNVEYVSANPTGPLTAASGRHAAYGDALARMLELAGHEVSREYYFNNAGSQVDKLGESVRLRARNEPVPEDGGYYVGDYVTELAQRIPDAAEADAVELGAKAAALIMEGIRATLHRYRVEFDTYFLEGSLHEGDPSPIDVAFARLREERHVYESEGALWLRTTEFGDDKDRVLRRSTGAPTYFAADVAYQEDKFLRGFDRAIYVLGADHHGYIPRLKAIASSLGEDPSRVEIPILQFVHIVEGGGRSKMSKRRGDFVTLDELIERIGVDATRWFMLSRSHDSTIDLDVELAAKQDPENPVYYVQYAHARIGVDPAQSRRGRSRRRSRADPASWRSTTPSASSSAAARVPGRGARGGRAARAAPDRELRARARRRRSRRSTATRRCSRSPTRRCRAFRIALVRRPSSARSRARSGCSASPPRSRCDAHRSRAAARAVRARRQPRHGPLQRRRNACRSRPRSCARAPRRSRSSPPRAARPAARGRTWSAAT